MTEAQSPAAPPVLEGENIVLTRVLAGDAEAMYEAAVESARELSRTMPWWHEGFSLQEMAAWVDYCQQLWEQGTHYELAIRNRASDRYLGSCALGPVEYQGRHANLSYWVRTSCTGRGVASQAARLVARWACETIGLQRVEIMMVSTNLASRRVASKSGATEEGTLRNRMFWDGRPYDAVVFSFIPEDFSAPRG